MIHIIKITAQSGHSWEEKWDDGEVDFPVAVKSILKEHGDIEIIFDVTDDKELYRLNK